jgi:FkbM family methyltransferase
MDATLLLMQSLGFEPRVVIDAGANVGRWATMAREIFPHAKVHMVEPQPACASTLNALCDADSGFAFHAFALTAPGVDSVRMIGGGDAGGGTGARVGTPEEEAPGEVICPARTLDDLFAGKITRADRLLLKLDLEGHEIPALEGASALLGDVEAIIVEVQFFQNNNNGRPVFADVLNFMRDRGFELYDMACLSERPRDMRLRMGDVVFVRADSELMVDTAWD